MDSSWWDDNENENVIANEVKQSPPLILQQVGDSFASLRVT
jgi:hypothetical protein